MALIQVYCMCTSIKEISSVFCIRLLDNIIFITSIIILSVGNGSVIH